MELSKTSIEIFSNPPPSVTVLGYNPDSETVENFCLYGLKNPDIGAIRILRYDDLSPPVIQ